MSAMGDENPILREERDLADHERAADRPARPGTWTAVLGTLLAVMAPLVGFLTGTIVGVRAEGPFGLPAMWVWMFVGLVAGGVAGVVAILGILRLARDEDGHYSGTALLGDFAGAGAYDAHGRVLAADGTTRGRDTDTASAPADAATDRAEGTTA